MIKGDDEEAGMTLIKQQINFFYDKQIPVHVTIKETTKDGTNIWYNGIIKNVSSDFFILNEYRDGEIPVFFLQVDKIRRYKEEQKDD